MDHLMALDGGRQRRRQHEELLVQQQGSPGLVISYKKNNTTPLLLQNLYHPNITQIAEKRLERLLVSINKSKQSRVALKRFESGEHRNDSCCFPRNGLKKRIALIDFPNGGLEKRHKKESSSCPHSSRRKKLLSMPPVSPPQTVWRHRTLDLVVHQNKFDAKDMVLIDFQNLFFEIEPHQDASIFELELDVDKMQTH